MNQLYKILNSKRMNDIRGVHKTLRQIDTKVLASALFEISEKERKKIIKYLSEKSKKIIHKEFILIEKRKELAVGSFELNSEQAQKIFIDLLLRNIIEDYETEYSYPNEVPSINLENCKEILHSFIKMADHSYEHSLGVLGKISMKNRDILFKKSMQLLLDGYEPLIFEEY